MLDSITAEPMTGLRSIAAGLHGRAGKEPPPARGMTGRWAERTARDASPEITAAGQMVDAAPGLAWRASGRLHRRGGRSTHGACLRPSRARCGTTGSGAPGWSAPTVRPPGSPTPAQAIGPALGRDGPDPARRSTPRCVALELPDDAALLKAMGQGELEAAVDEHDRAIALAPADVQAEIDQREAELEDAQVRAHIAGGARDADAQAEAETEAEAAAGDLARLAVADAARREWAEAHAGQQARARGG